MDADDLARGRTALVVNCSAPHYNLGAAKLADYLRGRGYAVTSSAGDPGLFSGGYDRVCLSVIFSWHATIARDVALRVKANSDVWAGGPGLFALGSWWRRQTGMERWRGLDSRFDHQRGQYRMCFASRGCPVGCSFCIVPRLEGTEFSFDPNFVPAPILCDNNLSALPANYQKWIIQRYQETETPLRDANSGFEPRTFDGDTYARWKPVLRGPWRFAFDDLAEEADVRRMMTILAAESPKRTQVYVLVGNEPIAACHERAQKVIEWGGEPYCQPVLRLNVLDRRDYWIRHDWTPQRLQDFARYYNRHLWRYVPLQEYSNRKGEAPPFRDVQRWEGATGEE